MSADVTGPETAEKAVFVFFDIFGFTDQTLQGADILSASTTEKYLVIVPDFWEDNPAQQSWYSTPGSQDKLDNFFKTTANPQAAVARVPKVMKDLKAKYPQVTKWAGLGYCLGGKIIGLASQEGTPFDVSAQTSPARLVPEDGAKIGVPVIVLTSKDEGEEVTKAFKDSLTIKNHVEMFDSQVHGWMSAR
jgi:dienelactone hydrolase